MCTLSTQKFNPCNLYLELILKTRKSVSSIVHHLHTKWGLPRSARGEVRLVPYGSEGGVGMQSWGQEATDVSITDLKGAMWEGSRFRVK